MFARLPLLLIGVVIGFSSAAETPPSEAQLKAMERAHAATDTLKNNFRKTLKAALKKGGPAKALPACKIEAPVITEKSAKDHSGIVALGRTSHRLRNPKNTPREWVKPYLEKYAAAKPGDIPKQEVIELGKNHYGYLEPIFVEPVCLNCHGGNLGRGLVEAIRKEYPEDKAVGFNVGDFRGLLWLEMKDGPL